MSFSLTVPRPADPQLDIPLKGILFVLGANGTGKSSLMHKLYKDNYLNARRISAHRQTWFSSDTNSLSLKVKKQHEKQFKSTDIRPEARWKEELSQVRPEIAIFDLKEAYNSRARLIADAAYKKDFELVKTLSEEEESKIKVINTLLSDSNIPIEISIDKSGQMVASKRGSSPYSIAELSDGERNALLIAANVLTVESGTLLLIDEPERHLHRSIISPLLTNLFSKRNDCAFVVSTHDVMLPLDNPNSRTLLIRDCIYGDSHVSSWDADPLYPETEIDDDIKKDILGARRKILFVEGNENSLDKSLYSIVFPGVSIIPKSSCRDVEHTVSSIRDSKDLHWVSAFGIVDSDRRSETDIDKLKNKGIYALRFYSVESIYYHPTIQDLIAKRQADLMGGDASTYLNHAKTEAIKAIKPKDIKHLSDKTAEKAVREEYFRNIPNANNFNTWKPIDRNVIKKLFEEEYERLKKAIDAGDLEEIISRYPVRESAVLDRIAKGLEFTSRQNYEKAVRELLKSNKEFVKSLSLFGELISEIEKA